MFGKLVVEHRRRLALTQEDLARGTGLSARTIRDLENGRGRRPRQASVRLLADAFGLAGAERERFVTAAAADPGADSAAAVPARVPAELPADVPGFVGRSAELADLDRLLEVPADGSAPPVVVSALAGAAGVGKTALAVRWAHRSRPRFPDGQLYVNLRGYDPEKPTSPADALARLLGALGAAGPDLPSDVDQRAARYRTAIAGRRVLVLLDNAATAEQVRPLLPGTPTCAVVVTSRDSLSGLVAVNGARRLDLDLLPATDARTLLHNLVGERVDAEPAAAAELADLCDRLPLALRVAAELAASRPGSPLAALVAELRGRRRLTVLDAGGDPHAAVATVFSWSTQHLAPADARAFRLLGLHPVGEFDDHAVAALTDTDPGTAGSTMDVLVRAHLAIAAGPDRYRMHDLLRDYARDQAVTTDPAHGRRAALGRLFDHYLATAAAAMAVLHPAEAGAHPELPAGGLRFADQPGALSWLDTERAVLTATAGYTATHGWPGHTVALARVLRTYLNGGHHQDAQLIFGHARDAARQVADPRAEADTLRGLGTSLARMGRYTPAIEHIEQALRLYEQAGDRNGAARAMSNLGILEQRRGRYAPAAEHLRRALDRQTAADDRQGQARSRNNLAIILMRTGRYAQARAGFDRALAAFRECGDRDGEAVALINFGELEVRQGRLDPAAGHYRTALEMFRRAGDRNGEAWALNGLGTVLIRQGDPERGEVHHRLALQRFRDLSDVDGEPSSLNGLGEAATAAGRAAEALAHHSAALAVAADTGDREQQAHAHHGLARAHAAAGDPERAGHHHARAHAIYTDLGSPIADELRAGLR